MRRVVSQKQIAAAIPPLRNGETTRWLRHRVRKFCEVCSNPIITLVADSLQRILVFFTQNQTDRTN